MKKEKRAQIGTITIILLILIILTSLVLVWTLVIPMIKERSEMVDISGLTINLEIKEVNFFVTGSSKIILSAGAGNGDIPSLKFVFFDDTGKTYIEIKNQSIKPLETKIYSFAPILDLGKIKKISVFPVFKKTIGREFNADINKFFEIPEGLVSWWRFDDANDFVGENSGSGGSLSDGELLLDGNNYFQVSDNFNLDISNEIAISALIFPESDGEIISKGDNYNISLVNNKIEFSYNLKNISSSVSVDFNNWSHVLINKNENGNFWIYLNGVAVKQEQNISNFNINNEFVLIGKDFKGKIDEVMIFNKTLAFSEIQSLYNNFKKEN